MDSFEWLATECADERYPMQLLAGELHCGDEVVPIPTGKLVNNGWGEIGSRRLIGEPLKPVPERLTLAWYSYAEDQFFEGALELPQAELTQLFRAGVREPSTREVLPWSKIIVGMGLGGWTSVWLAGSGFVREVASARLEPAELDWADVLDNPGISRSNYVRSKLQARLSDAQWRTHTEHGPPASTWPRYALRHPWQVLVEGVQVPLSMSLDSFNGERARFDFAKQPPKDLDAVPKRMQITWLTRGGRKLLTKIRFDEREVFDAFDSARVSAPVADVSSIRLRVEFGPRSRVSTSVESQAGKTPLARTDVELLSLPA